MTGLPTTRSGTTTKYKVGPVSLYITINGRPPLEVFAKADNGHQSEADGIALMASLALRHGCPAATVAKHLRFRRYDPAGGPGQPCSISDAIGRAIEEANAQAMRIASVGTQKTVVVQGAHDEDR